MAASLPYQESGIQDILILSSFLLALNLINSLLDRTLYCGLIGQVLIGVAWGTPGGKWLSASFEEAVVQLGYLGLIMIVFHGMTSIPYVGRNLQALTIEQGGLSTSIRTVKANLLLSVCVAVTGIGAPMALSFFLVPMVNASYIQCFAAGAALCSTSLGTTFTVLSTSGLASTRLGSVLSTAAMMDDVIGLVMVQIIASLGRGSNEISPVTVIRPILVSLAFAVLVPVACKLLLRPVMYLLDSFKAQHGDSHAAKILRTKQTVFVIQTALLLVLVVAASYAGASVLLAAYLAGIIGAWWDDKATEKINAREGLAIGMSENTEGRPASANTGSIGSGSPVTGSLSPDTTAGNLSKSNRNSTSEMYEVYYAQAIERVLKPLFFVSRRNDGSGVPHWLTR